MDIIEWGNEWLEKQNEKKKQYNRKLYKVWAGAHPERVKAFQAKYYKATREERKKQSQTWRKEHHEQWIASAKSWEKAHPKRAKATKKRIQNRRQREFGFEPLNTPFDGSEGHHMDRNCVIHIPKELHGSIPHCVATGKNMKEMNALVLDYFEKKGGG